MRVFLDTNVIASAVATRGLCADVLRTVVEFHQLVISDQLLTELRRTLKDKFGASPELIAEAVQFLGQDAILADASPPAKVKLKDADDLVIVSAAINGGAEVFITGDKEILGLQQVGSLHILSPRQFWERVRRRP
jgi:putative PIN family toxin of toxin-antitoxin system